MSYVDLNIVRQVAMILSSAEEKGLTVSCEHEVGDDICGELVE
jgi:hypothetical protein